MYVDEGGYKTDPEGFKSMIDNSIESASSKGMYVLLDWHILNPGDPWDNVTHAKKFFEYMSRKHGSKENILYEICNEPNGVSWSRVKSYAEEIIPIIRKNDPYGIIVVGTPAWSSFGISEGRDPFEIVNDPLTGDYGYNVMYAFHFYAASHGKDYRDKIGDVADQVPIFVTEWGAQSYTGDGPNDVESSQQWINLMKEKKISWTYWNYSDDWRSGAVFKTDTCPGGPWSGDRLKDSGSLVMKWLSDSPVIVACNDGTDNDGDGLIDMDDPGCTSSFDNDEYTIPASGEADTTVSTTDDWGTGYCANVQVTNNASEPVEWVVSVKVDGQVNDLWNGEYVSKSGVIQVSGASWNHTLNAGQSTSFGFCAVRSAQLPAACSDGLDNDGDSLVDMADPGCISPEDNDEFHSLASDCGEENYKGCISGMWPEGSQKWETMNRGITPDPPITA